MSDHPTVGIIGLGIGRAHIRAFQDNGCRIVAISQRNVAAADKIAQQYGIEATYARWQDLIEKARPGIVVIATPPDSHREIALAALSAGAHVLCEKPLAVDAKQAREMAAAAAASGKFGMTGFNWRFPGAMREMHARLARGDIGRIMHASAHWLGGFAADEKVPATWRMHREKAGHGAMGDIGVHLIDLLRWNLGEIVSLSARTGIAYPNRTAPGAKGPADADDHCALTLEFASGAIVTADISRVAHGMNEHSLKVFGARGALTYRLARSEPRWFDGQLRATAGGGAPLSLVDTPSKEISAGTTDPMEIMGGTLIAPLVATLLDGIRNGKAPSPSFEDGLRAQIVLEAIVDSNARRAWVDIREHQ